MMRAETTTAMIITPMSLLRPMAVKMESMEKTRLMRAIWVTTLPTEWMDFFVVEISCSSPSSFWKISFVAL